MSKRRATSQPRKILEPLLQKLRNSPLRIEEIAARADMSPSTVKKIVFGHIPNPGIRSVEKLYGAIGSEFDHPAA